MIKLPSSVRIIIILTSLHPRTWLLLLSVKEDGVATCCPQGLLTAAALGGLV